MWIMFKWLIAAKLILLATRLAYGQMTTEQATALRIFMECFKTGPKAA